MDDDDAIVPREVQYGSFCNLQLRAEVRKTPTCSPAGEAKPRKRRGPVYMQLSAPFSLKRFFL